MLFDRTSTNIIVLNYPVADLGFWKGGGHFFSKGGAVVSKKYFLGSIRGSITTNSFLLIHCFIT